MWIVGHSFIIPYYQKNFLLRQIKLNMNFVSVGLRTGYYTVNALVINAGHATFCLANSLVPCILVDAE